MMNPSKETGICDVYGHFGHIPSCKSDGWHSDIEAILDEFKEGFTNSSTCEKPR